MPIKPEIQKHCNGNMKHEEVEKWNHESHWQHQLVYIALNEVDGINKASALPCYNCGGQLQVEKVALPTMIYLHVKCETPDCVDFDHTQH